MSLKNDEPNKLENYNWATIFLLQFAHDLFGENRWCSFLASLKNLLLKEMFLSNLKAFFLNLVKLHF